MEDLAETRAVVVVASFLLLLLCFYRLSQNRIDRRAGRVAEGPITATRATQGAYYRTVPQLTDEEGKLLKFNYNSNLLCRFLNLII